MSHYLGSFNILNVDSFEIKIKMLKLIIINQCYIFNFFIYVYKTKQPLVQRH